MSSPILSPASAWGRYRLLSFRTNLSEMGFTYKVSFGKLSNILSNSRSRCRTCCICPRRRHWGTQGLTTSCWRQRVEPRAWRCHPLGSGKKGHNGMRHWKEKANYKYTTTLWMEQTNKWGKILIFYFPVQFFGCLSFVVFCLSHFLSRVEALWTSLRSSADILLGSWAMLPGMMVTMTTRARPLVIMVRDVLPPGGALVKCLLWPVIKRTHG